MQDMPECGDIAELGIGQDRCHLGAAGARRIKVRAWRHFSWNPTVDGTRAAARRSASSIQDCGRYSTAPTNHARVPVHSAAVTATWQFAILVNCYDK
jgi:hypothetical protein